MPELLVNYGNIAYSRHCDYLGSLPLLLLPRNVDDCDLSVIWLKFIDFRGKRSMLFLF